MSDRLCVNPVQKWRPSHAGSTRRRRTAPGLALLTVLVVLTRFGPAQPAEPPAAPQSLEYQVKAAFLLNFTKFIDWPAAETDASDFTICIAGSNPFGPALDQMLQGETVNGRKIVVERAGAAPSKSCQIVYFSKSEKSKELLARFGPGVLTVGEGEAFIREGGMIAFALDNRRVRFIVNLGATRSGMLAVSSRLLAIAKAVEK